VAVQLEGGRGQAWSGRGAWRRSPRSRRELTRAPLGSSESPASRRWYLRGRASPSNAGRACGVPCRIQIAATPVGTAPAGPWPGCSMLVYTCFWPQSRLTRWTERAELPGPQPVSPLLQGAAQGLLIEPSSRQQTLGLPGPWPAPWRRRGSGADHRPGSEPQAADQGARSRWLSARPAQLASRHRPRSLRTSSPSGQIAWPQRPDQLAHGPRMVAGGSITPDRGRQNPSSWPDCSPVRRVPESGHCREMLLLPAPAANAQDRAPEPDARPRLSPNPLYAPGSRGVAAGAGRPRCPEQYGYELPPGLQASHLGRPNIRCRPSAGRCGAAPSLQVALQQAPTLSRLVAPAGPLRDGRPIATRPRPHRKWPAEVIGSGPTRVPWRQKSGMLASR